MKKEKNLQHATELNKLITFSSDRNEFKSSGFRPFEKENAEVLGQDLKGNSLFFSSSVLGMEAISHVIEDQAINVGGKYSFFADFQKFSRMRPQKERYEKLCQSGNPITIFGVADKPSSLTKSYPNLREADLEEPVSLEEPSLSHNWIVVLHNPHFVSMALVANELPKPKVTGSNRNGNKLLYRNFEGFWTYDQNIINEVVFILEDYATSRVLMKVGSNQAYNLVNSGAIKE